MNTIVTSPYDGDSRKLENYCCELGLKHKTKVEYEEGFLMDLVVFTFDEHKDYLVAKEYYENYI